MSEETSNQDIKQVTPPELRNPTGKGGFKDNPQNRSDGRWSKENSFSYWMNYFKAMSVTEFKQYEKTKNDDETTVAESLAFARVFKARSNLKEFQEVADRTEGKPKQYIDLDQTSRIADESEAAVMDMNPLMFEIYDEIEPDEVRETSDSMVAEDSQVF